MDSCPLVAQAIDLPAAEKAELLGMEAGGVDASAGSIF